MALPCPETPYQVSDQDWVVQLEIVTQIAFTSYTCSNLFCLVYYSSLSQPRQTSCGLQSELSEAQIWSDCVTLLMDANKYFDKTPVSGFPLPTPQTSARSSRLLTTWSQPPISSLFTPRAIIWRHPAHS